MPNSTSGYITDNRNLSGKGSSNLFFDIEKVYCLNVILKI